MASCGIRTCKVQYRLGVERLDVVGHHCVVHTAIQGQFRTGKHTIDGQGVGVGLDVFGVMRSNND